MRTFKNLKKLRRAARPMQKPGRSPFAQRIVRPMAPSILPRRQG